MLSEQEKKELREMNSKMFAIQTSAYSNDCEECKRLKERIVELEDCIKDLQKDCNTKTNVIADYTSKLATNNLRIAELEKDKDYLDGRLQKQLEATLKLDKENEDLKKQLFTAKNERNAFKIYSDGAEEDAINLNEQLTKAKEIILKLYNAGRDVLMCRAEEKAYDNLSNAINDKSIEQFLNSLK